MRQAVRLIIWAFGQQNMSIDHEQEMIGGKVDSGAKVARAMEKSEIIAIVERMPEVQESWVCLAYTDDHTEHDLGVVMRHVLDQAARYGAAGQINVGEIASAIEGIMMMIHNAISKTINGRDRHDRQAIVRVLGISHQSFVPSRFWGRMQSAVDKITADLDATALDAVDQYLRNKSDKSEAA